MISLKQTLILSLKGDDYEYAASLTNSGGLKTEDVLPWLVGALRSLEWPAAADALEEALKES